MRGHNYNGYRGRNGTRTVLSVFVGVLAVLVVLLGLLLLFGQRYIYYTADGVRLDLPFLKTEPAGPSPDLSQVVVEVIPPAPQEEQDVYTLSDDTAPDIMEQVTR